MNITVIGTGYVGLVTGTCFAEMGHRVFSVDINADKIAKLNEGILPIYEPGLDGMVHSNVAEGRLSFTTSLEEAAENSNVFFIAVGTPPAEDGSADLLQVLAVARDLGRYMRSPYNVVVDKSTVPVGTADRVRSVVAESLGSRSRAIAFDVVSNPEFLKEGKAIEDFMGPDRIVIGSDSPRATDVMRELYAHFTRNHDRMIFMGVRDAEMTKYAANAMLATKISFMNEIANLCERVGVDVGNVRLGIGADSRIGYHFIYPGCGYGGSCFPKDVKALIHMADRAGQPAQLLNAVDACNDRQKHRLFEKIVARYGSELDGKTFALWGLAFKPGTDDVREAPSLVLVEALLKAGAKVKAYDPVANEAAAEAMQRAGLEPTAVSFAEHQYDALKGAEALVLMTEWKPFRNPDFGAMERLMTGRAIFDGRNQYDPRAVQDLGFEYYGIGRGQVL